MKVIPWTIDDPATMRKLIDDGVDGIITDYPDRLGGRIVAEVLLGIIDRDPGVVPRGPAGLPADPARHPVGLVRHHRPADRGRADRRQSALRATDS